MQNIEIRNGVRVGYEDMLKGAAQMSVAELERYADNIHRLLLSRKETSAAAAQKTLLEAIKNIIPAAVRRREKVLYGKMKNETITEKEQEELAFLINWLEEKSAERLELMARLAKLRGVGLAALARELRIAPPRHA
jgi:hypothetical protein